MHTWETITVNLLIIQKKKTRLGLETVGNSWLLLVTVVPSCCPFLSSLETNMIQEDLLPNMTQIQLCPNKYKPPFPISHNTANIAQLYCKLMRLCFPNASLEWFRFMHLTKKSLLTTKLHQKAHISSEICACHISVCFSFCFLFFPFSSSVKKINKKSSYSV